MFLTEPSGAFSEWKANAIGKKSKELREFLENKYEVEMGQAQTVRLAVETLLEVVESEKSIEICMLKAGNTVEMLPTDTIQTIVQEINKEKEEAEAAKKAGKK